jgi:chemotaxis protein MotB
VAAKGGGAWKVAYADFVTAMMAFFLVMWICAQDQKIKQAVARYFNNPMNIDSMGVSKNPDKAGALFDFPGSGSVPKSESVAMGQGRNSYTSQGESSLPTKLVGDWLHTDEEANKYWRKQVQLAREWAHSSKDVRNKLSSVDEAATLHLSKQLKDEITRGISSEVKGLHQNLLFGALSEVNWSELAEDMLSNWNQLP